MRANHARKKANADQILHFAKEAHERGRQVDKLIEAITRSQAKANIWASIVYNVSFKGGKGSGDSETGSNVSA